MKNYSQNNEQDIILNFIEHKNLSKGKLLEVGAFDGENFSNVRALLLKYPEWKATMVEPSSFCFSKIFEMYRNDEDRIDLINIAVVMEEEINKSSSRLLNFYESPFSAISSSIKEHVIKFKEITPPSRKIYVAKIGLIEILNNFGPFEFINIDIEGFSANLALQDEFNPIKYGCKLICIEHDFKISELQNKFVTKYGYQIIGLNGENIIFGLI
jgi:FkbM family methyltransferase